MTLFKMEILLWTLVNILLVISETSDCKINLDLDSNRIEQPLPYIRRQVKEPYDDNYVDSKTDDSRSKLISFLIKNVREVFRDTDVQLLNEFAENLEPITLRTGNDESTLKFRKTKPIIFNTSILTATTRFDEDIFMLNDYTSIELNDDFVMIDNLTLKPLPFLVKTPSEKLPVKMYSKKLRKVRKGHTSKDILLFLNKSTIPFEFDIPTEIFEEETVPKIERMVINKHTKNPGLKLSCVFCNNVDVPECTQPKNKLIPSRVCEYEDDACYSLHTPFGIVDRGCYSLTRNISTYVCSSYLCNFQPLFNMPVIFKTKQEWVKDVMDLSNTKRFEKSVLTELYCYMCHVNDSDGELTKDCLDGNTDKLPVQRCAKHEICGIRVIIDKSYVWRGCVKSPLYNYWIRLCDDDLCNHDNISIYDE